MNRSRSKGSFDFITAKISAAMTQPMSRRASSSSTPSVFKDSAAYQKRFVQRGRLRRMLGKDYATLVTRAMGASKAEFLAGLSEHEAARVRARTGLESGRFWRVVKGREFIAWPESPRQLTLFDVD
jgi:hypothetical protein